MPGPPIRDCHFEPTPSADGEPTPSVDGAPPLVLTEDRAGIAPESTADAIAATIRHA